MSLADDELREAFAAAGVRARPRSDCPPSERLWDAATGALEAAQTRAVVDHTATCRACAEAWRLATAIDEPAATPVVALAPRRARRVWLWPAAGALAAAAAVLAIVVFRRGDTPGYRDGQAPALRTLVSEDQPQAREALVLRWAGGPDGASYDLRVLTKELRLLHAVEGLAVREHEIPAATFAPLPPGTTLLWQVDARVDAERFPSPTFTLRLR